MTFWKAYRVASWSETFASRFEPFGQFGKVWVEKSFICLYYTKQASVISRESFYLQKFAQLYLPKICVIKRKVFVISTHI